MEIRPVGKKVLIKQEEAPQKYGGGTIWIPDSQRQEECKGIVIAVGKDVEEIKKGDYIQYADYITPTKMTHNDEEHLLIGQGDVLAILV
jgi:co-chaperonin GroES (HSP10)